MLAHGLNFRIQPIVRLTLGQVLSDNQQLYLLRLGYPMMIANQHRNNSPPPERTRAMTGMSRTADIDCRDRAVRDLEWPVWGSSTAARPNLANVRRGPSGTHGSKAPNYFGGFTEMRPSNNRFDHSRYCSTISRYSGFRHSKRS